MVFSLYASVKFYEISRKLYRDISFVGKFALKQISGVLLKYLLVYMTFLYPHYLYVKFRENWFDHLKFVEVQTNKFLFILIKRIFKILRISYINFSIAILCYMFVNFLVSLFEFCILESVFNVF